MKLNFCVMGRSMGAVIRLIIPTVAVGRMWVFHIVIAGGADE